VSIKARVILLAILTLLILAIGLIIGPIPQPQAYHDFADQRNFLGIANAWNVLSNIFFALAGIWGVFLLLSPCKVQFIDDRERWPWFGVSIGLILTAIGSSYYHLAPDNYRLVWDRLPMTIIFMSFAAALITERINVKLGLCLFPVLLAVGFCSVLYWFFSEQRGVGDLRLYFGVQAFTIVVVLIMLITPSPYERNWDLAVILLLFGLAHLFEIYDKPIAIFTDKGISGHTLKHFAGALAGIWLIRMIWKRKRVHNTKRMDR
jgi:hypothetical protein